MAFKSVNGENRPSQIVFQTLGLETGKERAPKVERFTLETDNWLVRDDRRWYVNCLWYAGTHTAYVATHTTHVQKRFYSLGSGSCLAW